MSDDIDGPRLARYISGQSSPEESVEVQQWLAEDPTRARLVAELEAAWQAGGLAPYEWGVDEGLRALAAARDAQRAGARATVVRIGRAAPARTLGLAPGISRALWRVAAAVLVVVGSTLVIRHEIHRSNAALVVADAMTEVVTRPGQRATLHLADGTRVELGVASRLRYARAFGETTRDVYLEGSGYFEVAHDAAHPFAVHTAHVVARDIGTKFGVRAYPSSAATEVVVADGAVAMAAAGAFSAAAGGSSESLVLRATDLGRLDADGALTVAHHVDVASRLAWTEGRLQFNGAPLRDVAVELGRWYDLDVQLADSSAGGRRLTATFTDEPVSLVLERIALALDLRVARHGRSVVLRPAP